MKSISLLFALFLCISLTTLAKKKDNKNANTSLTDTLQNFDALKWRNIGPFRGGRSVAVAGVQKDPQTYYFGSVGGGVWQTTDAGLNWKNISDGFFNTGSVGAIAVAQNDPNLIYVGMGEHAVRGVMSSHGDGMYKSTDAGQTWKHIGLKESRYIAAIRIHPENTDIAYVAVQGDVWAASKERGVYKTIDGGESWKQVLFVNDTTSAVDLSMDANNPRILYAGFWDNKRDPWRVRSGGEGSGLYKSVDGGESWNKINNGLPSPMGKVAVDVSPANSNRLYANIEAEGDKGGVYRSDDAGKSWKQVSKDRATIARAWYYIEIFADPKDEETVYVLNSPMLKSIDGGKTFQPVPIPHVDEHDMWINPDNTSNIILANDGGACITFNDGKSWSTQNNQPTAQFYRVITDNQFPYHIYGGQQDNSTVCITSRTNFGGIQERDWYDVAGGESAFLAFNNPDNPQKIYGTSIQGFIDVYDKNTKMVKDIMAYPAVNLGATPKDQKYRFNWNGPLINNQVDPQIIYHGGNKLLRSNNGGYRWTEISPDLTRNDSTKHTTTGVPFTNEAAGGEIYNTISYIASSPHEKGVIWVGSDDGLVHVTKDEGKQWANVSPPVEGESLINAIEVSPHDNATAYIAVTRYKFADLQPLIYVTNDYGNSWKQITNGIPENNFVRVVREDLKQQGLLYAGTENGLYVSFNNGDKWSRFQSNLPICPITDLTIKDNDLIAATSGRAFWILDDLGALQQSMGKPDTTSLQLYAPKTTYKFTFQEAGPANTGHNSLPGVIFDYYLPHSFADSIELKLEVLNSNGEILRTMSSKKPEKFKTWVGGPTPPKTIPAKPGLNRTSWNLAKDDLPAVDNIFVLGGFAGNSVSPGTYTLKLTYDSVSVEQNVELLADPRLNATTQDYKEQQDMLEEIETTFTDVHFSVTRLQKVKTQLRSRLELIEKDESLEELKNTGDTALENITKWEENLIQPRQKTFQDVINFENKLNAELNRLRSSIDSYHPKPTESEKERLQELTGEWEKWKTEMERIISTDIEEFNSQYKKSGLPTIIVPEVQK
ncbi:glycosyl hydrolase [Draconibacterium sp.]|nr:glycosyl hydrolase [Draconibacterium sp.]